MVDSELQEKYSLSLRELESVFRQIDHERRARARAIAADLKTGIPDAALMEKFQLSEDGFQRILEVLLAQGLITPEDLAMRRAVRHDLVILDLRIGARHHPALSVTVCDKRKPTRRYVLQDISEDGFCLRGMEVQVTEVKKIAVLGDDFGVTAPFEFEAQCRWRKSGTPSEQPLAGFAITKISPADLSLLLDFIETFSQPYARGLGA